MTAFSPIFSGPRRATLIPAYDSASQDYFDAVRTAGKAMSTLRRGIIDRSIRAFKGAGLWALIDDLWLLCPEDPTSPLDALVSLKQLRTATAVASPTWAVTGVTSDGAASYVDTGFVCATHGIVMQDTSIRACVYERTNLAANSMQALGVAAGSSHSVTINPQTAANKASVAMNGSGGGAFNLPASDSRGLTAASRSGSTTTTAYKAYKNGAALTASTDPTTLPSGLPGTYSLYLGANNNQGTATAFRATELAFGAVGAVLTAPQEASFYGIVQNTLLGAIGAEI